MLLCGNRIAMSDLLSDSAVSPDFDIKACKFCDYPRSRQHTVLQRLNFLLGILTELVVMVVIIGEIFQSSANNPTVSRRVFVLYIE